MAEDRDLPMPNYDKPMNQMNNPVEEYSFSSQIQSSDDVGGCLSKIKCLLPTCLKNNNRYSDPEGGPNNEEDEEGSPFENLEGSENDGNW